MAQTISDPREVKVCSSRMVLPAQTSAHFLWTWAWPVTALGEESLNWAESGEGKKHSGNGRACFHSLASPVSGQRLLLTPLSTVCCLHGYPSPRQCLRCSTQCHPLWLNCSILWTFDLPFLWIFPPLTPYCLPSLLLEYFLPEVCQTLNHLFACPCSDRNSQQGEQQQRLFCLFACCFLFILNIFFPPLLLPPHNKISSCAQKASLAILTTLTTLFSNLSLCMSFKSLNILNTFFHSTQGGPFCNMLWVSDCSTISLVFQLMQRCQLHNILICHRSALPVIEKLLLSTINIYQA